MAEIYLPTLHTFAMKNKFTGSCGLLRFKITPDVIMATAKEVDFEKSSIKCELWHGLYCYEKSSIEQTQVFPMSEDGRLRMKLWLETNL